MYPRKRNEVKSLSVADAGWVSTLLSVFPPVISSVALTLVEACEDQLINTCQDRPCSTIVSMMGQDETSQPVKSKQRKEPRLSSYSLFVVKTLKQK